MAYVIFISEKKYVHHTLQEHNILNKGYLKVTLLTIKTFFSKIKHSNFGGWPIQ